jgi:hypothetical protein
MALEFVDDFRTSFPIRHEHTSSFGGMERQAVGRNVVALEPANGPGHGWCRRGGSGTGLLTVTIDGNQGVSAIIPISVG